MALAADLILTGAAQVVTCRDLPRGAVGDALERGVIRDGAVACRDGRIVFVGSSAGCRQQVSLIPGGDEIDCTGRTVLPGLVDAHTHLPFAGDRAGEFRQRLAGASYEEIARAGGGIRSTVRATRAAGDGALVAGPHLLLRLLGRLASLLPCLLHLSLKPTHGPLQAHEGIVILTQRLGAGRLLAERLFL